MMKKTSKENSLKVSSAASKKNDAGRNKNGKSATASDAIKTEKSRIEKFMLFFIIGLALINSKEDKPAKIFTKKQKDELLLRVKTQIKNSLTVSATNIYKVNLGFLSMGRPKFLDYINNVIILMGGSTDYPTPSPILADISDMIILEATTRSGKNYIDADIYLLQIKEMMRQLCVYIANTCLNNVVILRSVGVRENKTSRSAHVEAPQATITSAKDTKHSGEVKVTVATVAGMMGIQGRWRYSDIADDKWTGGPFSLGVNLVFTGMLKGKTVIMQVCFKSAKGYGDWSDDKTYVVR